jgi:hypothetical protein
MTARKPVQDDSDVSVNSPEQIAHRKQKSGRYRGPKGQQALRICTIIRTMASKGIVKARRELMAHWHVTSQTWELYMDSVIACLKMVTDGESKTAVSTILLRLDGLDEDATKVDASETRRQTFALLAKLRAILASKKSIVRTEDLQASTTIQEMRAGPGKGGAAATAKEGSSAGEPTEGGPTSPQISILAHQQRSGIGVFKRSGVGRPWDTPR